MTTWTEVSDVSTSWDAGVGYVFVRYMDDLYVIGHELENTTWSDAADVSTTWTAA